MHLVHVQLDSPKYLVQEVNTSTSGTFKDRLCKIVFTQWVQLYFSLYLVHKNMSSTCRVRVINIGIKPNAKREVYAFSLKKKYCNKKKFQNSPYGCDLTIIFGEITVREK